VQQYQQYPTYDNDSTYQQGYRSYQTPRPAQRYPSYRAPTPAQTAPRTYSPPRSRGLSGGASDYDVSR
jgi:hypothetical protein